MKTYSIFDKPLTRVPEIECNDRSQFDNDIRQQAKPVILKSLVKDWPAVKAAEESPEKIGNYIQSLSSAAPTPTYIGPPEITGRYFYNDTVSGFNFAKRNIPLAPTIEKLLGQIDDPNPMGIYAGATSTQNSAPDFGKENLMPLVDETVQPLIWIGNSARIAPHFDADENIACSVAGNRRFLIFPPDQVENLYVGPIDNTMAGPPASMVDPRAVDEEKYPKFAEAASHALLAELDIGDALYIPPLWWHYVESEGPLNVLVNYWWNDSKTGTVMDVLGLAILVLRERPQSERDAWNALFQHYVFSEEAMNAVDHLPKSARGILDEPSPSRDAFMKQYLRGRLPDILM